jgi:hypothetical protein
MLRTYVGSGVVFIDEKKVVPSGRMRNNTRLSICLSGVYVAIMEVKLLDGVELPSGSEHQVSLRMISDQELFLNVDYEIRDPLTAIGSLRLINLSLE